MATDTSDRNVAITILKVDCSNFNEWLADIRRCFGGTDYWPILVGAEGRLNEPRRLATQTVAEHNTRRYNFHTWHQQSARACDILFNTVDPALWVLFNKSMTCREVFNIIRLRCNPEERARRKAAWISVTWDGRDLPTFWNKWSAACSAYMDTGPHIDRPMEEASQFLAAVSPAAARYEHIRTWKEVIEVTVRTPSQKDPDTADLMLSLWECVKEEGKRQRKPEVGSNGV